MGTAPKGPKAEASLPGIASGDLVLDRYRVVEQIASGGHSVVYRGQDERLARPVCIKVFSGLGGQSGVGRTSYEHFVQEAFALSRLTHPNTLRIYDFGHLGSGDAEGMPLQVCEYMNGGTLSNVVRERGVQSLAETSRVIGAMCAALAEAHGLGIVHRDIKPQNILFGTVGATKLPKLADFGIAKWSADDSEARPKRAEDTAIVAGQKLAMYSPSWAAPEQLAGQTVSAATDIYSLATVAVYMLSGKAVFADEDVYAGYKKRRHADEHVHAALEPLAVPAPVVELLIRALAFDPKKRVLTVDLLASELATALEPTTEETRPLPRREEAASLHSAVTTPPIAPMQHAPDPAAPPAAPTPASWMPPATPRQPWMAVTPTPTGPARRLGLVDYPQGASDRRVHFIHMTGPHADLGGLQQTRVRVQFLSAVGGSRVLHLKGMTCFVAMLGGRPSPAVQLTQGGDVSLVTPRAQEIGHIRIATGSAGGAGAVFPIGTELVTIGSDDCADPILFDFGPGSDAYFVYTRGRPIPKSPPHRR
ncbi:MAG TPA: serine/threonine-protein kinase [Kofleriaceae bacterium]|jgi:serine/threonine-protein kinase